MTDDKKEQTIVPYVVVFIILYIIFLVLMTLALRYYFLAQNCNTVGPFFCFDDFTCGTTTCNNSNACFQNISSTGLHSCLFGIESNTSQKCINNVNNDVTCDCDSAIANNNNNCFNGCASSLKDLPTNTNCCCSDETIPACLQCLNSQKTK